MSRRAGKFGRRGGFTLVETIVVLGLFGLVAGMALQLLRPPSERLRLESATRAFCATLHATRARAIATNTESTLIVDVVDKTYVSSSAAAGKLPTDAAIRLDIAHTQRLSPIRGAITFFPDGTSTGGDIILETPDARATIRINWLTGDAKCAFG